MYSKATSSADKPFCHITNERASYQVLLGGEELIGGAGSDIDGCHVGCAENWHMAVSNLDVGWRNSRVGVNERRRDVKQSVDQQTWLVQLELHLDRTLQPHQ